MSSPPIHRDMTEAHSTGASSSAAKASRRKETKQRRRQLRKSLAAKVNNGGKVASMVQELQEDLADSTSFENVEEGGLQTKPPPAKEEDLEVSTSFIKKEGGEDGEDEAYSEVLGEPFLLEELSLPASSRPDEPPQPHQPPAAVAGPLATPLATRPRLFFNEPEFPPQTTPSVHKGEEDDEVFERVTPSPSPTATEQEEVNQSASVELALNQSTSIELRVNQSASFESATSRSHTTQTASTNSTYSTPSTATSAEASASSGVDLRTQDTRRLKSEKEDLYAQLQKYETDFVATHGREVATYKDLEPVATLYRRYLTIKKECARRHNEILYRQQRLSADGASLTDPRPLGRISETPSENEAAEDDAASGHGIGRLGSNDDSTCVYQEDVYVSINPLKAEASPTIPTSKYLAEQNRKDKKSNEGVDDRLDEVVAAVAAILENDGRNNVEDPGDFVLIPGEEDNSFCCYMDKNDNDSIDSDPGRIYSSSQFQPFDEASAQEDKIMRPAPPGADWRGGKSNETTPERSNKKGKDGLLLSKGSPASVAFLSTKETHHRLGTSPLRSTDEHLGVTGEPPQLRSVFSSASSAGILHPSETGGAHAKKDSYSSSSRIFPARSPWSACFADNASVLSDEFDENPHSTSTVVRIRQTATSSRNVPRSNQRSIAGIFSCKPKDADLVSIESGGAPEGCKIDVCKAATSGDKTNAAYSSKPMRIDGANSFLDSVAEKKAVEKDEGEAVRISPPPFTEEAPVSHVASETIQKEEEEMTDITFPTFPEEATWSNMVDEMMKTLEDDAILAKKGEPSLRNESEHISFNVRAANSACELSLVMDELDSLKADFDGISKELESSNARIKQLELDVDERDLTIATLQLERDLAQADVQHLQNKLSSLEREKKMNHATSRRKLKAKDAEIARLYDTIEKLVQEFDSASKRVAKYDEDNVDAPPIAKIRERHIVPRASQQKNGAQSPLYPDDEVDHPDDEVNDNTLLHTNTNPGNDPAQPVMLESSRLPPPSKKDKVSRALDICRKYNKAITESPRTTWSKENDTSGSIPSFNANQATPELEGTGAETAVKRFEAEVVTSQVSAYVPSSGQVAIAPSEDITDLTQDSISTAKKRKSEREMKLDKDLNRDGCVDIANDFCCIQEASEFIQNFREDWREEMDDLQDN